MSKGSSPRPIEVPKEDYDKRWEAIFGKKKQPEPEKPVQASQPGFVSKLGFWYW